ncbi:MAG TPA: hypothetical protein VFM90_02320, partial [Cyclobacteriaceae bacterium]|nr:hypothetical protein [Cyclobacteriaceae bacterium]
MEDQRPEQFAIASFTTPTSSATWVVPAGVTAIQVLIAGGNGGPGTEAGGMAHAFRTTLSVTP